MLVLSLFSARLERRLLRVYLLGCDGLNGALLLELFIIRTYSRVLRVTGSLEG